MNWFCGVKLKRKIHCVIMHFCEMQAKALAM